MKKRCECYLLLLDFELFSLGLFFLESDLEGLLRVGTAVQELSSCGGLLETARVEAVVMLLSFPLLGLSTSA